MHLDECLIHKWNILLLPLTNYSKVMTFLILFKIISKFTYMSNCYNDKTNLQQIKVQCTKAYIHKVTKKAKIHS